MTNKKLAVSVLALLVASPLAHAEGGIGMKSDIEVHEGIGGVKIETTHITNATSTVPIRGVRIEDGVNTAGGIKKMEDGSGMELEVDGEMHASSSKERGIENAEMHADEHGMEALEKAELHMSDTDADDNSTTSIESASDVHSDVDFKQFVSGRVKKDERIKKVDVKDGTVEVDYEVPAKLFWFINSSVSTHASADAKGNVHVSYPWYEFLMSTTASPEGIETGVKANVSASTNANVAHVFDVLVKHLEASAGGTVAAN